MSVPSYEEVCEKLKLGPIKVKLFDGWMYYIVEPTSLYPAENHPKQTFFGRFRLCKGNSEIKVYYDDIVEILEQRLYNTDEINKEELCHANLFVKV